MKKVKICIICRKEFDYIGHHVKTKGSAGKHIDDPRNLMPLCIDCHTHDGHAIHRLGSSTFMNKFVQARIWLKDNGWQYDEFTKKWWHEDFV